MQSHFVSLIIRQRQLLFLGINNTTFNTTLKVIYRHNNVLKLLDWVVKLDFARWTIKREVYLVLLNLNWS